MNFYEFNSFMDNVKEKVKERSMPFINYKDFDEEKKKNIYAIFNSNDNKSAGVSVEDFCVVADKIYKRVIEWQSDDPTEISDNIQSNALSPLPLLSASSMTSTNSEIIQA